MTRDEHLKMAASYLAEAEDNFRRSLSVPKPERDLLYSKIEVLLSFARVHLAFASELARDD